MTTFYSSFYPVADGAKGSAAFLGAISTTIVYLYKRTTSILTDLDKPNGDSVYTFATADLNTSSITNGWSETIPSGDDPLWVVAATATGTNPTDTIESNEWTSPVQLARNGTDGLNTATVTLFKRSSSATLPSAPSSTTTYSFETGVLSGTLSGWSQSAPDTVFGKYLFSTTATVISTSLSDDILSSEWSDVIILTVNGEDGVDGQDGETGLTAFLTNEAHILSANSAGVVSSYSGASGSFYIYKEGTGDISSQFSLSTVSNPQTLTVAYTGTSYSITGGFDAAESEAYLTIRATGSGSYSGISIDKVFSLAKSKAGTDGSSAKMLSITPSRQIINYSGGGSLTPSSQTIDFTTTKQNTTAPVSWTIKDTLGNTLTPSTYLFATTGNTNSMTANQFNAAIAVNNARGVIVTGTLTDGTTLTDSVTIVKVVDGVDGVDGTPAIVANLSNDNVTVPAAYNGSSPILTSAITTVSIYEGTTDVSSSWSVSASPSAGVTGTLSGKTYTVTGFTSDTGYVDFTATRSGYANQVIRFTLSKAKAGTDGAPATVYSIETLTGVIHKDSAGTYSPSAITVTGYLTTGASIRSVYAGRFIIATSTDGTNYTNRYTSAANEGSYTYSIPASITHIRTRLYQAGGTTTLLDEEIIPIVSDGINGTDGTDGTDGINGISAYLGNDSAIVFTYADGTPVGFTGIDGYFHIISGTTDVTSEGINFSATASGCTGTINTADNNPVNGKVKGYYRVTAMSGDTATLTLSASYGGYTFTKTFNLSKSKAGYDIVTSLPATNLFQGRTVFLTTDNKLYRYTGSGWTTAVPAVDISGTLADAQIASVAASKVTGQLTDSQIASIDAATKLTGIVPIANVPTIPTTKLSGTITGTQIADDSITSAKILAGSITAGDIAADTITSNEIAANAITSNELAANAVTAGKIAAGSISANELAAGSVTAAKIAAGTITATELAAGSVTAAKIAAGTITATQIAADTITGNQIAANTITSSEIASSAITTDKLAAGSVTAAKLTAGEIISASAQIADGVITNAKIGNLEVSSAKIADLTVGTQKITGNAVNTTAYSENVSTTSVTSDYQTATIASVTFNKLLDESILRVEGNINFTSSDDLRLYVSVQSTLTTTILVYSKYGASYQTVPRVQRFWNIYLNGAGGTMRLPIQFNLAISGIPAGSDTYTITYYKTGGANQVGTDPYSYLGIKEEKK